MNKGSVGRAGSFAGWAGVLLLAVALPLAGQPPPAGADEADDNRIMRHGIFARLAATPVSAEGHYLAVFDGASRLPADVLETFRFELGKNLGIPVRLAPLTTGASLAAGLAELRRDPTNRFAVVLLTAQPVESQPPLVVAADERLVLINVSPLAPSDQLVSRLTKQALRGIGLAYGLALAGDPFSVMRPIGKGMAELDTFSTSFSPAESLRFNQNAETRGFPILLHMPYTTKVQQGLMPPIDPQFWPAWEKKHRKVAAETFRRNGFDPDVIAAEFRRLKQEGKLGPADFRKANAKP